MSTRLPTEEVTAWIRLSLEPDLGPALARKLLAAVGLPQDIYALSTSALQKYLPSDLARQLRAAPTAQIQDTIASTLEWLQNPRHHLLTLADPAYPATLLDIHDPPLVLYANGNLTALQRPALAVVGARSATPAGTDNAQAFAKHLAAKGWCIVSGLALGIDTAAHQGALSVGEVGSTIAVMGTGMDIVYPARNRSLAHQIAEHGLLLSEFPLGTRALPWQFPKRNRIVAGLSKGVLVVEAARQSGSLITARMASDMGREVFAIPGSIHSPLSRGCHALIRQGAKLVESAQDISDELGFPQDAAVPSPIPETTQALKVASGDPDHITLMNALGHDPVDVNTLQQRTTLDTGTLQAMLLQLELTDHITQLPDGRYQRRQTQLL
ncbi:DNA-protecting protein DprA [Alcaligenaceae bacterium]|nr:DNA-protecting protein DprA [Alcaligenaceae bacterium]